MKIITILLDSLNFHYLEPYGATHVQTPNLQRFATRAVRFDNHFVGSLPCMPARRELFTGRQEFLWRGWGHIEPWDRHLAVDAAQNGYVTQMITDHYHYWENGAHGYFEAFDGIDFVRGHELDMLDTAPLDGTPQWAESIDRHRGGEIRQRPGMGSLYYSNARHFEDEEASFPCAQVMRRSAEWLERNHVHPRFLLWAECFDPHEPHYLPEPYRTLYSPDGKDHPEFTCWPPYQNRQACRSFVEEASDLELDWIRAQYAGKVTMVDRWLGTLLDTMDRLDIWRDTMVIVTTDHGHDLCYTRNAYSPYGKAYPHPESHARIPLLIYHPDAKAGRTVEAMTCAVDINATIRDACGDDEPNGPDGRSLLPLLLGRTDSHRDQALFGIWSSGVCLATPEWILAQGTQADSPCHWYSTTGSNVSADMQAGRYIPGVEIPQWRVPHPSVDLPSFLWRRQPFSLTPENMIDRDRGQAAAMRDQLREMLSQVGCPLETWDRLGLPGA